MGTQATVNPSEEAIRIGPLGIRFLLSGVHRFDNFGTDDAKQLSIITPAIMGPAYFREASQVVNAAAGGPPDTAKMVEIFQRHGMTIAALPPTR